jgi:hypothetical protein
MVNAEIPVPNAHIFAKFSAFLGDSGTSKTRLNILADLKLTKVRPAAAPAASVLAKLYQ